MEAPALIPVASAELLVGYFCHTAKEEQRMILDEWICENDGNMRVFEQCLEVSLLQKEIDSDRLDEFPRYYEMNLN